MAIAGLPDKPIRFSFVIPCYNYGHFLTRVVMSVVQQFEDCSGPCELLLVDDGSTDDTADVGEKLAREFASIRYVHQQNAGPSAARNNGATLASGEYLWFVDADDELVPGAISAMDAAITRHPQEAMIFGGYRSHATDGRVVEKYWRGGKLSMQQSFIRCITGSLTGLCIGSSVIRREAFLRYQFPVGIQNGEDFILYAHIIANESFLTIPQILVNTYRHEASLRTNLEKNEETGMAVIDCLFDANRLPTELMPQKARYVAHRHLELARSYYLAGDYPKVRVHYRQALAVFPASLFKFSYLRQYLRALLRG